MKKKYVLTQAVLLFAFCFLLSVFSPVSAQYQYKVLYNFGSTKGAYVYGPVIRVGNSVFGMARNGGLHGFGCIFSVDTAGNNFKHLVDFDYGTAPQGASPYGGLVFSGKKLFGTTYGGGTAYGVVFSVDTSGANYKTLLDFNGSNGYQPRSSLIISGGVLYGTTVGGGAHGVGLVFSIDSDGTGYKDLHDFNVAPSGWEPYGYLVLSGNVLYGMAASGGTNAGIVFSLHTDGSGYKTLLNFTMANGASPLGSLVLMGKTLFGMTYQGGANNVGCIFSIDTNGNNYKHMYDFKNGIYGSNPMYTALTISGTTLYGTTGGGGINYQGTLFSIDTSGSGYKDLYDFKTATGSSPWSPVTHSGIWFYGGTISGGTKDSGVVYAFRSCTLNASITVNSNVSCHADSNGSATVSVSAGVPPYTYSWSTNPVQTNATATGLKTGSYSVTVYDNSGCTSIFNATITQPNQLKDSINSQCAGCCNCHGQTHVYVWGGTKPYTYLWSNGRTNDTLMTLSSGWYKVTITDSNGCSLVDSVFVHEGPPVSLSKTDITCFGANNGSASVSVSGNYSYLWSPGGQTTASINGLSAGTYNVTITNIDTGGCSAQYSCTIIEPPLLNVSASKTMDVKCYGQSDGSGSASASGGTPPYAFHWGDGENTASATALSVGTTFVTVTDKNGCTATASVTLTQPTQVLLLSASVTQNPPCSTVLSCSASATGGTPPYAYHWNHWGNQPSIFSVVVDCRYPPVYSPPAGLNAIDANGCMSPASANFYYNIPVQIQTYSSANPSNCNGNNGTITVNVCGGSGNYNYTISPGGTYSSSSQSYTFTGLSAKTYTVTVQDGNGCYSSAQVFTLTQPAALSVSVTGGPFISCGSNSAYPCANATGGTAPYTYNWQYWGPNPSC